MHDLRCPEHPHSHVRRCRTTGDRGRGIYPECVPNDGSRPHVLSWEQVATDERRASREVRIAESDVHTLLSPSELVVLCAAANGLTAAETAQQLGKGTQTVKTQRGQALLKLGARNTAQAVCIATECGILTTSAVAERPRIALAA
jgi:DNA-binding CsgD family transcriptional regulator